MDKFKLSGSTPLSEKWLILWRNRVEIQDVPSTLLHQDMSWSGETSRLLERYRDPLRDRDEDAERDGLRETYRPRDEREPVGLPAPSLGLARRS